MSAPESTAPAAAAAPPATPLATGMRAIRVIKIVVNSGVGESGEARTKAEKVLQMVTHQKPVATRAHSTNRDFGIRQGQEIGAKVTLRGSAAVDFLRRAFEARDRQLDAESIDRNGNFSFGIADYTDFAGHEVRPGDRHPRHGRRGRARSRRLPGSEPAGRSPARSRPALRSTREETRAFLTSAFGVTLLD